MSSRLPGFILAISICVALGTASLAASPPTAAQAGPLDFKEPTPTNTRASTCRLRRSGSTG